MCESQSKWSILIVKECPMLSKQSTCQSNMFIVYLSIKIKWWICSNKPQQFAMVEVLLIVTLENMVFSREPFHVIYHIVDVWKLCKAKIQRTWSFHMGIPKGQHKNVLFLWIPVGIFTGYVAKLWMGTVITLVTRRMRGKGAKRIENERKSLLFGVACVNVRHVD